MVVRGREGWVMGGQLWQKYYILLEYDTVILTVEPHDMLVSIHLWRGLGKRVDIVLYFWIHVLSICSPLYARILLLHKSCLACHAEIWTGPTGGVVSWETSDPFQRDSPLGYVVVWLPYTNRFVCNNAGDNPGSFFFFFFFLELDIYCPQSVWLQDIVQCSDYTR